MGTSSDIIKLLLNSKTESERRKVILNNKVAILNSCSSAVKAVNNKEFKNYKLHVEAAIECANMHNYRGAQSTANVCFDSLLDKIIDTASLTNFRAIYSKVSSDTTRLKNISNVPVNVIYGALQAQLVSFSLRTFNRLTDRIPTKYTRHPSAHSVSAKQYNEINAVHSIMIVTSLLLTTNRLGRGWLSALANY